jgi:hypothetical protein
MGLGRLKEYRLALELESGEVEEDPEEGEGVESPGGKG